VNIYRSATGQVAGSIRPPKPYHNFASVSRLGGDRTFVATVVTDLSHAAAPRICSGSASTVAATPAG